MVRFRKPAVAAPEKVPHVMQHDGWVQNVYREKGKTVRIAPAAARYLVGHGVLKTKEDHEATETPSEAPVSPETEEHE